MPCHLCYSISIIFLLILPLGLLLRLWLWLYWVPVPCSCSALDFHIFGKNNRLCLNDLIGQIIHCIYWGPESFIFTPHRLGVDLFLSAASRAGNKMLKTELPQNPMLIPPLLNRSGALTDVLNAESNQAITKSATFFNCFQNNQKW